MTYINVLTIISCLFAALSGFSAMRWWETRKQARYQRNRTREGFLALSEGSLQASSIISRGFPRSILVFMQSHTQVLFLKPERRFSGKGFWSLGTAQFEKVLPKTGLAQTITKAAYLDARTRFCFAGLFIGFLVGIMLSNELALLLGCLGAALGWKLPLWALKQEKEARKNDLENHLSEMLEVLSLGLRSGLSFDASFELYSMHFSNALGRSSLSAQQQWQMGLTTREQALRALADTYDSTMFSRVVENMVRSLRFGSSLVDSLESSALESRLVHKATMEEKVAKAPVKMLIPTAALILPAMLLLVLGPVMLDMMQGF